MAKPDSSPQVIKITWGKNSNSSKNIYSQWPANKKSKSLSQLRRNSCEKVKILRKFAFQILQKRAGKEGSSALAVLKGFVFVWEFEFSVATRNIHHVPCKSHFQYKYLAISWSYGNTEFEFEIEHFAKSANALQNISLYSNIPYICILKVIKNKKSWCLHLQGTWLQFILDNVYGTIHFKKCTEAEATFIFFIDLCQPFIGMRWDSSNYLEFWKNPKC